MKRALILGILLTGLGAPTWADAPGDSEQRPAPNAPALGRYRIDRQGITISGVSSGAYMAVQMQVAFSSVFKGVGSVAGGVYGCAQGEAARAQDECTLHPEKIRLTDLLQHTQDLAASGLIDPIANLSRHQVYLFSSPRDSIIKPENSEKLAEFFQAMMVVGLQHDAALESAHGFPTRDQGAPCARGLLPWLLDCGFDTAEKILEKMYGPLKPRASADPAQLQTYTQLDFGSESTPLYPHGWVYVPKSCERGETCRLHVALHGCQMNPVWIQDQFARLAGYNEWAESNQIIVLYPQSAKLSPANPYACWDWFGFTGSDYANKKGAQMRALMDMIERVQRP